MHLKTEALRRVALIHLEIIAYSPIFLNTIFCGAEGQMARLAWTEILSFCRMSDL